jgi:3-oxoadipate enol-lactonase
MRAFREARVKTARITLQTACAGVGDPLLLVSGTGADLRVRPGPLDGPLPERFTVWSLDQRGQGRSDVPPGPYTMADYADDLAALHDALGLPPLPVVAISFGGMVAQHFALRHPEKVSKLVLCCTSAGGAGGASYPLHELEKLAPAARFAAKMAVSDLRHDAAWQAQQGERLVSVRDDAQRQNARRVSNAALIRGAALQLAARKDHDCHDALPGLTLPTLLCAGRFDGIAPLANMEALAAALPQATLQVFEGGHLFLRQDRTAWPAILQWLTDAPEKGQTHE